MPNDTVDIQTMTASDIFMALDACLEREKAALLTGDLDAIAPLMEEKSDLIARLNALGATEDNKLSGLKDKAERNQVLLNGALDGIRRVSERMALMQSLRHSFDTYDQSGNRQTIEGEVVRHVEKRA
ncbi:MAG: flagellar protein FlgN [Pseudomonadota bacterium]